MQARLELRDGLLRYIQQSANRREILVRAPSHVCRQAGQADRQAGGEISQLGVKSIEQSTEACMQSVARLAHSADPSN